MEEICGQGSWKYKEQDEKNGKPADAWLGPDGIRAESVKGEWPVSYHGTSVEAAESIVSGDLSKPESDGKPGYKPTEEDKGGIAVYAGQFTKDQNKYLTVLQNRVNPDRGHLIFESDDIWRWRAQLKQRNLRCSTVRNSY